jgi:hypothetical protein
LLILTAIVLLVGKATPGEPLMLTWIALGLLVVALVLFLTGGITAQRTAFPETCIC